MDVGIYFDLRLPDPRRGAARYAFVLELCEEAEALGCDAVWFSEHHGFDDGYLPQPLTMAAAAAARTRRMRIGTAVVVAPLHHPASIAEQAAVVDLISDGRLDLGLGAGYRVPEFSLFGASLDQRFARTDATPSELRRLWSGGGVTPAPVQAPIPTWLGYQGPKGARRAGRLGERLLSSDASLWPAYREGLLEGGHDPGSAQMCGGVQAWVSDDPERDWATVAPHLAHQIDSYTRHAVEGTDAPAPRPVDPDRLRRRGDEGGPAAPLSYFQFGTAEDVAAMVRARAHGAPVSGVFLWAALAHMQDELVLAHVRRVCTELRPRLADAGIDPDK
jgi:alkanesulfonate monooxygenase SsuD/methylene tetrahydromethanopterin reductase-like flavin-dependent oxidoreductase (luciferase family)